MGHKTTVFTVKTVVFLTFTHYFPGLFFSLTPIIIGVIFLLQAFSVGVKLPQ